MFKDNWSCPVSLLEKSIKVEERLEVQYAQYDGRSMSSGGQRKRKYLAGQSLSRYSSRASLALLMTFHSQH